MLSVLQVPKLDDYVENIFDAANRSKALKVFFKALWSQHVPVESSSLLHHSIYL